MDALLPIGGGCGFGGYGGAGSAGIGGAIGGLIGSWLGNGMGWGGGRSGGGYGGYGGGVPVAVSSCSCDNGHNHGGGSLYGDMVLAGQISSIQDGITAAAVAELQGQNTTNMALCQGFSGVVNGANQNTASLNNTMVQGFSGLNNTVTIGNAANQQSLCQGFSSLNTAILSNAKDAALLNCQSTGSITKAIGDCCCETQRTIMGEGSATRSMMANIERDSLLRELNDAKCQISSLKSQQFTSEAIQAQTNQLRSEMNANTANLIHHMGFIAAAAKLIPVPTTGTGTGTGATA